MLEVNQYKGYLGAEDSYTEYEVACLQIGFPKAKLI